jgi:hypothetical protein
MRAAEGFKIMKINDFLFYSLEGDTASPPTTYVGEIIGLDPGTGALSFREIDTGQEFYSQLPADVSGPWDAQSQNADYVIKTHDVYTAAGTDPTAQGVAVVTFPDGNHYICQVEAASPTIDVVFYQQPYHRLSFDVDQIMQSDWDTYPVGGQITSIEAYVLDTGPGQPAAGSFPNGWWSLAQQVPAFPGRIGGAISPFAVVVHTTDMVPESWDGLIHRWTTEPDKGEAAHFLIGRDATAGVIQLVPITKNANHAGNNGLKPETMPGKFVAGTQEWYANSVSVGIEIHCAGGVRQVNGDWRLIEDGVAQGAPIPDDDVIPDPQRPGRGWHKVTDYQYEQLGALLDGLETVLYALPEGCVAQSFSGPAGQPEATPGWGIFPTGRRVGHVSLDTYNRSDPWPPTCDWMRARG